LDVKPEVHKPGLVMHTALALDPATTAARSSTTENNQVASLCRRWLHESYLSRTRVQRSRPTCHQEISEGGKRVLMGKSNSAGGLQSCPSWFSGGALIGDDAGFLNASRIKGSHADQVGALAAERRAALKRSSADELSAYPESFRASWLHESSTRRATSSVDVEGSLRLADVASTRCSSAQARGRCGTSMRPRTLTQRVFQKNRLSKPTESDFDG